MSDNTAKLLEIRACNPSDSLDLETITAKFNETKALPTAPTPQPDAEPEADSETYLCDHIKASGVPCGTPALRGKRYCYFHQLWRTRPVGRPLRRWNPKSGRLPLLEDADAVQLALQQVLDGVLDKRLDLHRARLLLYGLQTAAVNVLHTSFDDSYCRRHVTTELR